MNGDEGFLVAAIFMTVVTAVMVYADYCESKQHKKDVADMQKLALLKLKKYEDKP